MWLESVRPPPAQAGAAKFGPILCSSPYLDLQVIRLRHKGGWALPPRQQPHLCKENGRRGPGARWQPPSRPNVVLPTSFPCLNKPRYRSSRKAGGCSHLKAPIPQAFSCIDQNRDGIICKADLRETYSQLGKVSVPEEELDAMLQEGKGPINFTVFLTLFGEKLNGTDPEEAILSAFRMFDPSGKGVVNKDEFKQLLLTQADKFSPAEVRLPSPFNTHPQHLLWAFTHDPEPSTSEAVAGRVSRGPFWRRCHLC
ncbi:myosin regulatory light chain 2, atrial isoform isoform X3 [Gorilla gorilla gorilla]|uniref:myosin regulatory light chain 2, atrial isoform isoform X3 n=1 Tax=Gorilla gorilla gorilla TaxID=9595 RepID=UPI00300AE5FD